MGSCLYHSHIVWTVLTYCAGVFAGSLPAAWASLGAFPFLQLLELRTLPVNGTLPAEWGSSTAFQRLQSLSVQWCDVGYLTALPPVQPQGPPP